MKRLFILVVFSCVLLSCKKDKVQGPVPQLTTADITAISYTTATGGGNIVSDGGISVIIRGVCWSIHPSPTTNDSKTSDGMGGGNFVSSITGLSPNTSYYIRAYATNANGTAYGLTLAFTTDALTMAILTTSPIDDLNANSATSGGNITSDGGSPITARGVVWGTNSGPTISGNSGLTIDGAGTGIFISNINGLSNGTVYYLRAYASNANGTAYGNEINTGSIDADGNIYSSVFIGTQVWLKGDLNTSKFANGDTISLTHWSFYNNDPQYDNPYGKLYSFAAVADSRLLCPSSFHVASGTDWDELINYLGGSTVAGGSLKESGDSHWVGNVGATNSSGFTAVPGGRRADDGTFAALTVNSIWWSSTVAPGNLNAFYYSLFNGNTTTFDTGISQNYQMSIRCVK